MTNSSLTVTSFLMVGAGECGLVGSDIEGIAFSSSLNFTIK